MQDNDFLGTVRLWLIVMLMFVLAAIVGHWLFG